MKRRRHKSMSSLMRRWWQSESPPIQGTEWMTDTSSGFCLKSEVTVQNVSLELQKTCSELVKLEDVSQKTDDTERSSSTWLDCLGEWQKNESQNQTLMSSDSLRDNLDILWSTTKHGHKITRIAFETDHKMSQCNPVRSSNFESKKWSDKWDVDWDIVEK